MIYENSIYKENYWSKQVDHLFNKTSRLVSPSLNAFTKMIIMTKRNEGKSRSPTAITTTAKPIVYLRNLISARLLLISLIVISLCKCIHICVYLPIMYNVHLCKNNKTATVIVIPKMIQLFLGKTRFCLSTLRHVIFSLSLLHLILLLVILF